jgi:hypothetical protein
MAIDLPKVDTAKPAHSKDPLHNRRKDVHKVFL